MAKRSTQSVRSANEALRQSESRYLAMLGGAAEGIIIVSEDGAIQFVNARAEAMFGYSKDELLGEKIEKLVPDAAAAAHTAHREHYVAAPRSRPMGEGLELFARRKDGSMFPAEVSLSYVETDQGLRVMAFVVDVTERKRTEEIIRGERDRAQRYLDVAGVMIIALGPDGRVLLINKKGCEILGYDEHEIVGQDWFDRFLPAGNSTEVRRHFNSLMAGETQEIEHFQNAVKAKGGRTRLISWHNTVLRDPEGRATGTLSSGEDITDLMHAEEEARRQQRNLVQADKMATLGILVSGVAHEINNPNNFILLNANIISKVWHDVMPVLEQYYSDQGDFALAGMPYTKAREKIGSLIEGISAGAMRIQKIVKNLKDFAREDTGDLNESVDLNDVVESSIVIVNNLIGKSTNKFSMELAPEIPRVKGNFQLLEQLVINLITNACHALDGKDKRLVVATGFDRQANKNFIRVEDQGVGISEANLDRIMDPFFTTKRDSGGTGLGLSIAYNIVKDHEGEISVTSEPGVGTTIVVFLPASNGFVKQNGEKQ